MKKYLTCLFFLIVLFGMTGCSGKVGESTTAVKEETKILPGGGTNTVYVITNAKEDSDAKAKVFGAGAVIEEAGYVVKEAYRCV